MGSCFSCLKSSAVHPLGANVRYLGAEAIQELLVPKTEQAAAPILLLKASYVLKMPNRRVGMRQELEEQETSPFVSSEMLERYVKKTCEVANLGRADCLYPPIVVISYCWKSKEHPDPAGEQFAMLQHIVRWYMANRASQEKSQDPDFGIFIDFHSIYQGDRTQEQQMLFTTALHNMDVLYGHRGTMVFVMSKVPQSWKSDAGVLSRGGYDERGWTTFEGAVASLSKSAAHCLDMGTFELPTDSKLREGDADAFLALSNEDKASLADPEGTNGRHWPDEGFLATLEGRRAPMHPTHFRTLLEAKHFSVGSDKAVVAELFEKVAVSVLGDLEDGNYSYVRWQRPQLESIGSALVLCHKLKELRLVGCGITTGGLTAFASAIPADAAPALTMLRLSGNALEGTEGWKALAEALRRGALPKLTRVDGVGYAGQVVLQRASERRQWDFRD